MMTQRIVLKVDMGESEKSRKKAMKVASGTSGVRSVSIQGQNDQLVVLGEEIDTAELTRELRKKVGPTNIMAVQAAPPPRPQQQQSHAYQMGYQNIDMAPARRCICEIPNSGFCGFCRPMSQNNYQMMVPSYHTPVTYGGYQNESDGCRIM